MESVKTDHPNLVVDQTTRAVINTDVNGYQKILAERKRTKREAENERLLKIAFDRIEQLQKQVEECQYQLQILTQQQIVGRL